MKKLNLILYLTIAAVSASSCSSLRIPFPNKTEKKGKTEVTNTERKVNIPKDREDIHAVHKENSYSAKDLEQGVVTGDWTIEEVNGTPTIGESTPFLKMVPSTKRVYGNNGCNTINASYTYNQEAKELQFSDILSTMRMCGTPGITDSEINAALAATKTYSWDHEGFNYHLYFYDASGQQVMKLMHQNFDFLNGSWHITSINGEEINDPEMNIVIDIDQGKIHGNTGCNIFNGAIDIDMETANTINFHNIITTRMACPNPENQTRLIVGLEDASYANPIDENTVELLNLLHEQVLTLIRIR